MKLDEKLLHPEVLAKIFWEELRQGLKYDWWEQVPVVLWQDLPTGIRSCLIESLDRHVCELAREANLDQAVSEEGLMPVDDWGETTQPDIPFPTGQNHQLLVRCYMCSTKSTLQSGDSFRDDGLYICPPCRRTP